MNSPLTDDWNELARMWQADAAGVSMQEIDVQLQREKRRMTGVIAAEFVGLGAGAVAALSVMVLGHLWLGVVILVFGGTMAWLAVRMRRASAPAGSHDLLQSLKDSIEREDWIAEQLRFGRILSFVALFAIVQATSAQLLRLAVFSAAFLIPAGIGCGLVLAALAGNLWLSARARRRRARLRYLDERMKA